MSYKGIGYWFSLYSPGFLILISIVMKKIHLEGIPSTLSVMEWIRSNDCPWVQNLAIYFSRGRRDCTFDMMVSSLDESEMESTLELDPLDTWYDYEGMKRLKCDIPSGMWLFWIDGHYYYATI